MFTSFSNQSFPDTDWVDFSNISTINGWGSFDNDGKVLIYKIIDNILYVIYRLDGISNATSANFTIPVGITREFTTKTGPGTSGTSFYMYYPCSSTNNGVLNAGNIVVQTKPDIPGLQVFGYYGNLSHSPTWTASGIKRLRGQFFIPI